MKFIAPIALCLLLFTAAAHPQTVGWPVYNGGPDGDHYSRLTQINGANVHQLRQAWSFDTGEKGGLQSNPLIVGRTLYAYTHTQKVIALDAATGKLKWKFDSGIKATQPNRGVAYWTDGHHARILAGVMNFLYCLDASTGKPIPTFGENGRIDLRKGLRDPFEQQSIALTTPGIVYRDLIIVGGRNPESHPAPPGDIRAFSVRTGKLRWIFHTIPRPGERGYETWPPDAWKTAGAANNWAGMAIDAARGIVYVPTGSAVMDFYGADRAGDNLFANCLIALDANTGKRLWHFQAVHHDIWDRDYPSEPALFTFHRDGESIPAIAQTSKQGFLFLFNRLTGQPLFPIHERSYPSSPVPGEMASATQPLPDWPQPYARQRLSEDLLTTRTPEAHAWALKTVREFRNDGQFVPFDLDKQTVVFPGFDGGAEWGGPAIDPVHNVLYVNANEMAWTGGLTAPPKGESEGARIYQDQCAACHGDNRAGDPPTFPSLLNLEQRMAPDKIRDAIRQGTGRMPAYPSITGSSLDALLNFLRVGDAGPAPAGKELAPASTIDTEAYTFTGYRKFLDPDGFPAIAPPWGTLTAIDLNTGNRLWQIPLGEYPDLARNGMKNTGSENYGGPVVTAGGVLFIGATVFDHRFRAFDSSTGKLLWEMELPFAGIATPSTYMIDGRQFVVIASSGGRDPKGPVGGSYIAFSLPR